MIVEDSDGDDEETPQHQKVQTTDSEHDIKELEEKLKEKDKEIRRLRRLNLNLQEGLADTIKKVIEAQLANSHQQQLSSGSGEAEKKESVLTLMNPTALDYAQRCEGYKKLTRTVMDSVFTLEEMAMCSVTGKKGIVGEKRQPLDVDKVKSVIDHVKSVHKGVGDAEIKACMAQKLKDIRRRAEKEKWEPSGGDQEDEGCE